MVMLSCLGLELNEVGVSSARIELYIHVKRGKKKILYLEFGYHKKWTIYTREKMEKKLVSRIWIVIKLRFFINLEIIREEKLYIYIFLNLKFFKIFCNLVKPLKAIMTF